MMSKKIVHVVRDTDKQKRQIRRSIRNMLDQICHRAAGTVIPDLVVFVDDHQIVQRLRCEEISQLRGLRHRVSDAVEDVIPGDSDKDGH